MRSPLFRLGLPALLLLSASGVGLATVSCSGGDGASIDQATLDALNAKAKSVRKGGAAGSDAGAGGTGNSSPRGGVAGNAAVTTVSSSGAGTAAAGTNTGGTGLTGTGGAPPFGGTSPGGGPSLGGSAALGGKGGSVAGAGTTGKGGTAGSPTGGISGSAGTAAGSGPGSAGETGGGGSSAGASAAGTATGGASGAGTIGGAGTGGNPGAGTAGVGAAATAGAGASGAGVSGAGASGAAAGGASGSAGSTSGAAGSAGSAGIEYGSSARKSGCVSAGANAFTHHLDWGTSDSRIVLVGVYARGNSTGVQAITYDGKGMTRLAITTDSEGTSSLYFILEADLPASAGDYTVSALSYAQTWECIFDASSFHHVSQVSPPSDINSFPSGSMSRNFGAYASPAGAFAYDFVGVLGVSGNLTPGTGQVKVTDLATSGHGAASYRACGSTSPCPMSWTVSGGNTYKWVGALLLPQ